MKPKEELMDIPAPAREMAAPEVAVEPPVQPGAPADETADQPTAAPGVSSAGAGSDEPAGAGAAALSGGSAGHAVSAHGAVGEDVAGKDGGSRNGFQWQALPPQ